MSGHQALQSSAIVATAVCVVVLAVLSLLPSYDMVRTGAPKVVEHFVAYGATGLWAGVACARSIRRSMVALLGLVILAAVLEYSQRWAPGRDPAFDTFFASSVGAFVGVLAASWARGRLFPDRLAQRPHAVRPDPETGELS